MISAWWLYHHSNHEIWNQFRLPEAPKISPDPHHCPGSNICPASAWSTPRLVVGGKKIPLGKPFEAGYEVMAHDTTWYNNLINLKPHHIWSINLSSLSFRRPLQEFSQRMNPANGLAPRKSDGWAVSWCFFFHLEASFLVYPYVRDMMISLEFFAIQSNKYQHNKGFSDDLCLTHGQQIPQIPQISIFSQVLHPVLAQRVKRHDASRHGSLVLAVPVALPGKVDSYNI